MNRRPSFDVCVRGGGPVGRTLALVLAHRGLRVALVERERDAAAEDPRSFALNAASMRLLRTLKVGEALLARAGAVTPVAEMRVQGDDGGTLRFSAWQQRVRELASIVDAQALEAALDDALRFAPAVSRVKDEAPAALVALCEGRDSTRRDALGVEMPGHDYGQTAIAARLGCDRPHAGIAWQWFRAPDVLALLPTAAPADAAGGYSLVWSLPRARAEALLASTPAAFEQALEEATGAAAGRLTLASARASWPLRIATAERWHGRANGQAWLLLGDAAHSVHPLAGQGLNLGFADVRALDEVLAERARDEPWRSIADPRLLERYARRRRAATAAMGGLTDGLQLLFGRADPWSRELRNRGLGLVDRLAPLKRWLGQRALQG
ncbi:MAG TPA: FAD-dependent monooxygenase [Methylibium sp.]|uniref:FAD-dependent monooxygenase n=1 Tax=Methylibium sp. TaxID=2067992 RepID=UPI002DBB45EE|nr:FAD-dependent monooxygenase [Methylibium sp.]HEU4460754.1 FAD-dependent monooxygenase [Methylibium sp.]